MSRRSEGSIGVEATSSGARHGGSADSVLLVAFTLWALNFSIVKFGVSQFEPLAFAVIRFGLCGLILLLALRMREGSIGISRSDLPLVVLISILGITLTQACFVYALSTTGASDMALLTGTGPLVTVVLATAVGLERFGRLHWTAVGIGLLGVVLVVSGGTQVAVGAHGQLGDLLALGNVVTSSAATIPIRHLMRRQSAHRILTYQMLIGTTILLPFAIPSMLTQNYAAVSLAGWGSLAYSAICAGILTNLLYFSAIGQIGPSRAAMFQYLQVPLGVLFAVVLLGESVTGVELVGGALIIGSVMLGRTQRREEQAEEASS